MNWERVELKQTARARGATAGFTVGVNKSQVVWHLEVLETVFGDSELVQFFVSEGGTRLGFSPPKGSEDQSAVSINRYKYSCAASPLRMVRHKLDEDAWALEQRTKRYPVHHDEEHGVWYIQADEGELVG